MPTYEYECGRCGERFEQFQRITDDPLEKCPGCGAPIRRLLGTGAAVICRGSASYARADSARMPHCGQGTPCCEREVRCDRPPCGER
jgi:putative FmdB family regulatory protein